MTKVIPVYQMQVDEDLDSDVQMDFISLVTNPAIQKNFHAFDARQAFKIQSEDQQIISGPAMLADIPIYRYDPEMGEYYVVFSRDTIMNMAQKFFRKGFQNNINLFHDMAQQPNGAVVFESFVTDKKRGILPMMGFEDAKDGSWFVSMKIYDKNVWTRVKAGEFLGFSIEGIFGLKKEDLHDDLQLSEEQRKVNAIKEILSQIGIV